MTEDVGEIFIPRKHSWSTHPILYSEPMWGIYLHQKNLSLDTEGKTQKHGAMLPCLIQHSVILANNIFLKHPILSDILLFHWEIGPTQNDRSQSVLLKLFTTYFILHTLKSPTFLEYYFGQLWRKLPLVVETSLVFVY